MDARAIEPGDAALSTNHPVVRSQDAKTVGLMTLPEEAGRRTDETPSGSQVSTRCAVLHNGVVLGTAAVLVGEPFEL